MPEFFEFGFGEFPGVPLDIFEVIRWVWGCALAIICMVKYH